MSQKKSKGCLNDLLVLGGTIAALGLATLIPSDGCRLGSGHTSGESKPKPERIIELPKIEEPKIEEPKKQEGCLDILVDLNQKLGDERETLTRHDLPELLKSSKVGPTPVNQYLRFGAPNLASYEDPKTRTVMETPDGTAFHLAEHDPIFDYELEFEGGFVSKVDNNGSLVDLVGSDLNILGQTYRVVRANYGNTNHLELILSSGKSFVDESPKNQTSDASEANLIKMHNVNGKEYVVESKIDGFGVTSYKINGESIKELLPGQTRTLKDGMQFTHLTSLKAPVEAISLVEGTDLYLHSGTSKTEYIIGSNIIKLRDSNFKDNQFEEQAVVNETQLGEDGLVKIKGQVLPDLTIEIQGINYRCLCDSMADDIHLKKGENLREQLDTPETLFGPNWNISYQGPHKHEKYIVRIHEK